MLGDTGRVNLCVAGVSEEGTVAVHLHSSGTVGSHGVGGEEEGVAVSAGTYNDCMCEEALNAAGNEVAGDDTTCTLLAVLICDEDDVEHLVTGVHLDLAFTDLAAEGAIGAEQQLLTGLTFCVEGTRNLCATEGTVVQETAVFTCERYALCYALVDDIVADLSQTIYVSLASAIVATLDGIVVETINGVTIVLIVLGRIDTALCSDRVCTTGRILDTEVEDIESHLCERSCCGSTGQTGTNNDDVETTLVGRVDELLMVLIVGPLKLQRTSGDFGHLGRDDSIGVGFSVGFRSCFFERLLCFSDYLACYLYGLLCGLNGYFFSGFLSSLYNLFFLSCHSCKSF